MITILLLLSAFKSSLSTPIVVPNEESEINSIAGVFGNVLPRAMDVARFRTKQDIVWSCLATIFACTWVAVHPNLPGPGDSGWTRFKRQTTTMAYAMIAPEFVTFWAIFQWIGAKQIVREFNKTTKESAPWYICMREFPRECWIGFRDAVKAWFKDPRKQPKEWTLTHGFMIQMGGFILYDGDTPKRALTFEELKKMIDKNKVDPPTISEHEINDKSKGDFLTKLVVVLQTSWFVFQCLARWILHLPVTELEVVTLAFASLNIITYGLWWKKPQNVLVAVRVQLKHRSANELSEGGNNGLREGGTEPVSSADTEMKERWMTRKLQKEADRGWVGWLFGVPYRLVIASLRPLSKMGSGYSDIRAHSSPRVHMFFSEVDTIARIPFLAISLFFGGLHFIPWSLKFPSTTELWLWRSSAIFVTAEPLAYALGALLDGIHDKYRHGFTKTLLAIFGTPALFVAPLYILARLILLVLAFTTLRALPPGWDIAIEWTTFLPHA